MIISTSQADQILVRYAGVADEHVPRFLERIRQLRRLGVPSGVPRGRGVTSGRTVEQLIETALAVSLLQAGLASSSVAELVRREWVLARTVLMLFDKSLMSAEWPGGPPEEVYWVVRPSGLADFQKQTHAAEPQLTTMMLFKGQDLGAELRAWSGSPGSAVIVIRGRDVVYNLRGAYAAAGIAFPGLA